MGRIESEGGNRDVLQGLLPPLSPRVVQGAALLIV
jgi:hypothetical protein